MTTAFTFDEVAARRELEALNPDELPHIWLESPARSIDDLFCEVLEHLARPNGHEILLYPLVHEYDRDGMVVTVHRPYPAPGLSISMDLIEREKAAMQGAERCLH